MAGGAHEGVMGDVRSSPGARFTVGRLSSACRDRGAGIGFQLVVVTCGGTTETISEGFRGRFMNYPG